ncbi:unnamed protein product [Ceutorhynchus assimilis]|uniref:CHK kinase-like domain-containing protein n=1 Tax=Ceutorhynchus assimilis TaxID=467358 RepID=A0A9P0DC42_9CUCU|nr:unnamed protein product [Ceutorhynchus assimilis]
MGHYKSQCPHLKSKIGNSVFSAIFLGGHNFKKDEWYLDSGASVHLTTNKDWLVDLKSVKSPSEICIADKSTITVEYGGNVNIKTVVDSEPGGNYFGIITKFIVKHGNTRLQLVLKKASLNQEARQKRAILPAFEREYELYNNVLPELMKFQIAHSVSKKFTALPKYYNGTNENEKEAILMEDLNAAGFRLWKRLEPMDFEHMSLIFQEYAKLHAISLALRHKQPKAFENLTENIKLNFLKQREVKMPAHYKHMRQVVLEKGAQAVLGNAKAQRCYNQFQNAYWQYLDEDQENPENDILVVSHGDCHPDNILFKYDEITAKPKELRFIDWQLSSTESPINDISFVLFTCAGEDVLSRCEELFQIYHGTIEENLTEFGCDSDEVGSFWL